MQGINTINDLMNAAATAALERDEETLYKLLGVADGWMQTPQDRSAQKTMINAYLELIERETFA